MSERNIKGEIPKITTYEKVKQWVEAPAMQDVLQRALPKGMDAGTWSGAALAYVRTAKDMNLCTPLSVMGGMITIASLGLRLDGVMGHAYLTVRAIKDRKGKIIGYEAQVQLGYKGMVVLVYRNPEVQEVEPIIVYQNDEIDFQKGTSQYLNHRWPLNELRGEMRAVYAGLRFKNGFYSFQIHNIDDVMELRRKILLQNWIRVEETQDGQIYHRKPYNKNWYEMPENEANYYPWIGHLVPMILKTAIRWSQKFWPTVGSDFNQAATLVELDDAGVSQGMAGLAAEHMPPELRAQAETTKTLPKGAMRATAGSRLRGEDLTKQMLAEATARGSQGEQDSKPMPTDAKTESQGEQGATQGEKAELDGQGAEGKTKDVQDASKDSDKKKKRPKPKPSDQKKTNDSKPMTDEEIELALQREQEEWEAGQVGQKKGK